MDRVVVTRLLSSKKEDEASAAQHLLADAAVRASQTERDEAVAVLLDVLEKDERRIARRARAALWAAISLHSLFAIIAVLSILHHVKAVLPFLVLVWSAGNAIGVYTLTAKSCSKTRVRAALALARHGDLRALGPLIEAFAAAREAAERVTINEAIEGLLPRVRPGEDTLLNGRQSALLQTALMNWSPNWFTATRDVEADGLVLLLKVAALVGDKNMVPALTAVAGRTPNRESDKRVIQVAHASLATLKARLDEHNSPVTGPLQFGNRP
jgi:hypothetical protein